MKTPQQEGEESADARLQSRRAPRSRRALLTSTWRKSLLITPRKEARGTFKLESSSQHMGEGSGLHKTRTKERQYSLTFQLTVVSKKAEQPGVQ